MEWKKILNIEFVEKSQIIFKEGMLLLIDLRL